MLKLNALNKDVASGTENVVKTRTTTTTAFTAKKETSIECMRLCRYKHSVSLSLSLSPARRSCTCLSSLSPFLLIIDSSFVDTLMYVCREGDRKRVTFYSHIQTPGKLLS